MAVSTARRGVMRTGVSIGNRAGAAIGRSGLARKLVGAVGVVGLVVTVPAAAGLVAAGKLTTRGAKRSDTKLFQDLGNGVAGLTQSANAALTRGVGTVAANAVTVPTAAALNTTVVAGRIIGATAQGAYYAAQAVYDRYKYGRRI